MYAADTTTVGYRAGLWAGAALGLGRGAYVATASTFRFMSGAEAVAARNELKGAMSGLGLEHPRIYTYEQMLAKYGSDQAVAAAASRTNPAINGAAALQVASVAGQSAASASSCSAR
jgi:hypothetical protein